MAYFLRHGMYMCEATNLLFAANYLHTNIVCFPSNVRHLMRLILSWSHLGETCSATTFCV